VKEQASPRCFFPLDLFQNPRTISDPGSARAMAPDTRLYRPPSWVEAVDVLEAHGHGTKNCFVVMDRLAGGP